MSTPNKRLHMARAVPDDPDGSRKVYVERDGMRVPQREIRLAGGEPPLRVYDTTGPGGEGQLPPLRAPWIARRVARGDTNFSQMHCARRGEVTEEMRFIAIREN